MWNCLLSPDFLFVQRAVTTETPRSRERPRERDRETATAPRCDRVTRSAMHVVVNGRRAGSVTIPSVEHYGREATPMKPTLLGSGIASSPTVTPVASPDGVAAHQTRHLDTDETKPAGLCYQLPPSRLRSPARWLVRNLADVPSAEDLGQQPRTDFSGICDSTTALERRNNELHGQLEAAIAQLASKRLTKRMLSRSTRVDLDVAQAGTASSPNLHSDLDNTVAQAGAASPSSVNLDIKAQKVQRARLKRSMLLARGLGTTRLELKQLREDVVSAQKQMAQEIDAVIAHMSAAVANAGNAHADAVVGGARVEQFMDVQMSVATSLRELVLGLPGIQPLTAGRLPAPSLSVASVGEWLASMGLAEHAAAFVDHEIDGKALMELTDTQLRDDLRVLKVGQRNAILATRRGLLMDNRGSEWHQPAGRQSDGRPKSSFFRPPRLQLATSLLGGRRTPRSKLLSRATKAKLDARLATLNGRVESAARRQERQSRASTLLLDLVGDTRNELGFNQQMGGDNCSDAGSSVGSSLISGSEDRYSDDFDVISLTTAGTELDVDPSSAESVTLPAGRSSSAWQPWSDSNSNVEAAEDVGFDIVYDSELERLSSASSWSDSQATRTLKVDFLAGITTEEMDLDAVGENTASDTELVEVCDTSGWSRCSASALAELVPTPRRGDNLHLTTLSTRSYSDEEEEGVNFDLAREDTVHTEERKLEPEPDALTTQSFALPSGQSVSVCADIFLQLRADTELRTGNMTFAGDA